MEKYYCVYILTNKSNKVLYTGVTGNLRKRIYEHKNKRTDGFSKKYNLNKLVYYEVFHDPENAILREKQLKAGPRKRKLELVNRFNACWKDLFYEL